jgi:predicted lipid carrier protein YhbT
MDAQTLFDDKLPAALTRSPQTARELNAVFFFRITGDTGGDWTVDLKSDPPSVHKGATGAADCSIEMTAEDFGVISADFHKAIELYFQGRLKVAGDVTLATRLQTVFSLAS